jgi:hypothetical protein
MMVIASGRPVNPILSGWKFPNGALGEGKGEGRGGEEGERGGRREEEEGGRREEGGGRRKEEGGRRE